MNKTIAALGIAGLSFSSVAKAEVNHYLKLSSDEKKLVQITIDLSQDPAKPGLKGGTKVETTLATGKRSARSTIKSSDFAATKTFLGGEEAEKAKAVEFASDGYTVGNLVAALDEENKTDPISKALIREEAKNKSKMTVAKKAQAAATAAYEEALTEWEGLVGLVELEGSDEGTTVPKWPLNGDTINAWEVLSSSTGETLSDLELLYNEAGDRMDSSVFQAYDDLYVAEDSVREHTEEIRLTQARLAKAKAEKNSAAALLFSKDLLDLADALESANSDLAEARTALTEAVATFNKEVLVDLTPEEQAEVRQAEADLKAIRAEWIALPARLLAAQTAGLKAKAALDSANGAVKALNVPKWKFTNCGYSLSQADEDDEIILVLQTPDGKVATYSGPGVTEASPMFALAARTGYVVSQLEEEKWLVNGELVDKEKSAVDGTASAKQSFVTDGALDLLVDEEEAAKEAPKYDVFARVKNGKILLNGSKEVKVESTDNPPTTSLTYVLDKAKALKHGLVLKMGLLSGKWVDNKESVTGVVGTFSETNTIIANEGKLTAEPAK
jgi:hypothetical protein